MILNLTVISSDIIIGAYVVVGIYALSVIISTLICSLIMYITCVTPHLRTPTNILVINTCLCTLFFAGVSTIFTICFFVQSMSTDWWCRIRGYLCYVAICLLNYSLVIQAISRFLGTALYKYRQLLTMKSNVYLVLIQLVLCLIFPLSTLITKDITFRPFELCFIPSRYQAHNLYLLIIDYWVPILVVVILYVIIYRKTITSSVNTRRSVQNAKRDRELAQNILILLGISLFGGFPFCVFVLLSGQIDCLPLIFYFFAITTPAISIILEKLAIVVLHKEIRTTVKRRWIAYYNHCRILNRIVPFSSEDNTRGTTNRIIT